MSGNYFYPYSRIAACCCQALTAHTAGTASEDTGVVYHGLTGLALSCALEKRNALICFREVAFSTVFGIWQMITIINKYCSHSKNYFVS